MIPFQSLGDAQTAAARSKIDPRCVVGSGRYAAGDGPSFESINPESQRVVARYSDGADLVPLAVATARQAFDQGGWSGRTLGQRAAVFESWAALIVRRAIDIALMDTLEMGMPISQSLSDVIESANALRNLATLAPAMTSDAGVTATGTLCINIRSAIGVIAAITPWNFPFNQAVMKVGPPLIMGNSVVLKPSEVASGSALLLAELALEAGLPEGGLNVITGRGHTTGAALVSARGVDKITFTGSTPTGAAIQRAAALTGQPVPLAMELGGKSPQIVCASFEAVTAIAPAIAHNVFWNSGQVCTAGSRLIVHEDIADRVIAAVQAASAAYGPGDPLDPSTRTGPVATKAQYDQIIAHMDRAEQDGAAVLAGGSAACRKLKSYRAAPTIYDGVSPDAPICTEEVFGPVLVVSRFKTTDEAVALANASGFGLTATAWTRDLSEGHTLANALRGATVTINARSEPLGDFSSALGFAPAGRSGFGEDYGFAGLKQFTHLKLALFNTG